MSEDLKSKIHEMIRREYKASLERDTRPQIHLCEHQIQQLHDQGKLHHYTKGTCLIVTSIKGFELLESLLEDS